MIKTRTIILLLAALGMLVILPLFLSPNLLNAAIKMMIAALFALAFTLAMGQAGMLSFGHAAYYGLGAFAALHLMRAVEQKLFGFPTPLIPLAGALVGFRVRTRVRLVRHAAHGRLFLDGHAGAGRAAADACSDLERVVRRGVRHFHHARGSWGVSFGDDAHVYYLTLGWFVVSAWCMWAFTKTPVGRLALALRDNEQRVRFLGFNAHVARTPIFAISCLFAGVAGALLAIANEATNYTIFSAQASANVVLQTFIGGAGTFFGPALGAIIMTFFARVTSDLTRSWLLYQGLIFVLVMLFAPQGLGGLVALHARKVKAGGWKHLVAPYLLCLVVGLLLIAGLVFVVESIHVVMTDAYLAKRTTSQGEWVPYELFGRSFEPASPATWAIPIVLLAIGGWLLPSTRRITQRAWLAATRDPPGESATPSPAAAAGQGAPP